MSELEFSRIRFLPLFEDIVEFVRIGICQNWNLSELELVRIGMCQNWNWSKDIRRARGTDQHRRFVLGLGTAIRRARSTG